MKKKTAIVSVLLGMLLIGIVSAGLIDYFGKIVVTVEVEKPVFYLDGSDNSLLLNEIPDSEVTITIPADEEIFLMSNNLGIDKLYEARFDIIIWVKVASSGNILELTIINEDNEIICGPEELNITKYIGKFWKREISCSSSGTINLEGKDKIGLKVYGVGENSDDLLIKTGKDYTKGYSRIEITST